MNSQGLIEIQQMLHNLETCIPACETLINNRELRKAKIMQMEFFFTRNERGKKIKAICKFCFSEYVIRVGGMEKHM